MWQVCVHTPTLYCTSLQELTNIKVCEMDESETSNDLKEEEERHIAQRLGSRQKQRVRIIYLGVHNTSLILPISSAGLLYSLCLNEFIKTKPLLMQSRLDLLLKL